MKTLFNKPSTFIKYALTIMAFAVVLATVFVIGFGFNASAEFGGVYELTIDCFDETKIVENTNVANQVLAEYGYNAKETIVEERSICDTIVIRYASKSAVNAQKIETDLTNKLGLNENLVTVSALSLPSANRDALKMLLAFGISLAVVAIYVLIRMDWRKASTVALCYLFSALLPLSICAISRVEISMVSLAVIYLMSTATAILVTVIFSKLESIQKHQEHERGYLDNYLDLLNENKVKAIIPTALMLLVFVCLIFTFSRALVFAGLVGVISLIIFAFIAIIFAPNFYLAINSKKSKNNKK